MVEANRDINDLIQISSSQLADGVFLMQLSGKWRVEEGIPEFEKIQEQIEANTNIRELTFDTRNLTDWGSGLLTFLIKLKNLCALRNIRLDRESLPEGAKKLIALASAVPENKDARKGGEKSLFLVHVGEETLDFLKTAGDMISFIGEVTVAFIKLLSGKASYRKSDLVLTIQQCGPQALPIVSLISLLIGLILAFIGAVQLELFGAQIYVADLVGIAMVRVMGAVMTGIIMAGRTGAAFAAQLGTMQSNEEIDAMTAMGISPMEFLVLPRMLALIIMMPLLCLYADLMGVLGGAIVGVGMLDLSIIEYFNQSKDAIGLNNLFIGLFHSLLFGVLVSLAGCLKGIKCGRSASSVGLAATSAVVTGIVSIIITTAVLTVMFNIIGI